jgi:HrpA-like RNA helicase
MFLKPDEDVEEAIDVTPQQDALLNHYQTMHDDEKVDTDLLLDVIHYIHKSSHGDGAILVFLPGWQEISEFNLLLESSPPFSDSSRFLVLPLHSGIPSVDQRRVLQRPPTGKRKIVLSTNIAETSLTIEDVSFVVDTGRAKEKDYDPHLKTSTLQPTWISQASAKQRKGRAGRTKAGVCFHLFSSRRYQFMRPFVESELLRTPLEEMCLFTKKLGLAPGGPEDADGVPAFLCKAMSPPHEKSISNALELLVDLGAILPETNDLTNLGQCLSILSLEPRVGKMVIWSYLLGCARVTSQMAVAMSYKSPFALPPPAMRRSAEKAQVELSQGSESDQVTVYNTMIKRDQILKKQSEGAWRDFCRRNFLSPSTTQMVSELRRGIARELNSLNFPDPMKSEGFHNRNQNKEALWQAALSAGLYPNVCTRQRGDVNFSTMTNRKCKIHVSSVNAVKGQPLNNKCQIPEGEAEFVCFGEMVKGAHMFTISQTTHLASPLPLLLLCGTALTVHPDPADNQFAILGLDDWIIFKCHADIAAGLVVLRKRLDAAFLKALAQPSLLGDQNMDGLDRDAIDALGQVLQSALKSTTVR